MVAASRSVGANLYTFRANATSLAVAATAGAGGGSASLSAALTRLDTGAPLAGQTLTFTVNGVPAGTAVTGANGVASVGYGIPAGTPLGLRTVAGVFAGDGVDSACSGMGALTVTTVPASIAVPAVSGQPGTTVSLAATLIRSDTGAALSGKTLMLTVNGTTVGSATTASTGKASWSYAIPAGTAFGAQSLLVTFAGNSADSPATGMGTLTVAGIPTGVAVGNVSGTAGKLLGLTATLTRTDTKAALSGKTLTFAVGGVTLGTAATYSTGTAYFNTFMPSGTLAGTQTVTVTFAGDAIYSAASGTGTATITAVPTALAVIGASGQAGTGVTLTANLTRSDTSAALPSRTVTLSVNGTIVGTATTDANGKAVFAYTIPAATAAGNQTVAVMFAGDSTDGPATGTATLTILAVPTALTVANVSGQPGASITVSAALSRSDTGAPLTARTVTFALNGMVLGTAITDTNGNAYYGAVIPASASAGTEPITVTFAGDATYSLATGAGTLTVGLSPTSLAVTNVTAPAGNSVTLSAVLTRSISGLALAGQTLSVSVNGTLAGSAVTDGTGTAILSYAVPAGTAAGVETVTVAYAGDASDTAISSTGTLTVTAIPAAVAVGSVSGPSGSSVVLTATLTRSDTGAGLPNKTVTFTLNGASVGTATTDGNGNATYSYAIPTGTAAGTQPITANFAGDAADAPGNGTGTLTITVVPTVLAVPSATGVTGSSVTFAATLTRADTGAGIANETVTFTLNGTTVGTATTDGNGNGSVGYAIPAGTAIGTQTLTVSFAGDAADTPASAAGTLTVNVVPTAIAVANISGQSGNSVTLTALLTRTDTSAGLPNTALSFAVNGTPIGTATTDANGNGSIAYTIPTGSALGSEIVTVSFAGDAGDTSAAGTGTLTVTAIPTLLTTGNSTAQSGGSATLSAVLTRSDTGAPIPNEAVAFVLNGTTVGTATTDVNGNAAFSDSVPAGTAAAIQTVTAVFAGDATYNASNGAGTLTVTAIPTTLAIASVAGQSGGSVSLVAALTRSDTNAAMPSQTVSFTVNGVAAGSAVTDANGNATLSYLIPSGASGSLAVSAAFAGDLADSPSSGTGTLTVTSIPTTIVVANASCLSGGSVTLGATLTRSDTGAPLPNVTLSFLVNGASAGTAITDVNGNAALVYVVPVGTAAGTLSITVNVTGGTGITYSAVTGTLTVTAVPTAIAVPSVSGPSGASVTLSAMLTRSDTSAGLSGKTLSFAVNGTAVGVGTTDANGNVTFAYAIPAGTAIGTQTIAVSFAGDASTSPANGTGTLTVTGIPTAISVTNASALAGSTASLTAALTRTDTKAALQGRTLGFSINGVFLGTAVTYSTGKAIFNYKIPAGTAAGNQVVTVAFPGDTTDTPSNGTGTLTVTALPTALSSANASGLAGSTVTLTVTLTRSDTGAALQGKTINFAVNGVGVGSATTYSTGVAYVFYKIPAGTAAGTQPVTVTFAGDAADAPATSSGTLTITPIPTALAVDTISGSAGKTVSLSATLTRSDTGALLQGKTLSFSVGGVVVGSGVTYSTGKAYFNYAIPTGTAPGAKPLNVSFAGDANDTASSGAGTLTTH